MVEAGLTPSHIVGTSFGAVVGAAFAAGATYDELRARVAGGPMGGMLRPSIFNLFRGVFAPSLLSAESLRAAIAQLVPAKRFADLKIPLTVTATDWDSGDLVLFGTGVQHAGPLHDAPLQDVLYAACALPVYFPPGEIAGRRYVDGGLRAVLPIEVARGIDADLIVAINVGPGFDEVLPPGAARAAIPALIRAHGEAERIMMAAQTERMLEDWPADAAKLIVVRAVREREATFAVNQVNRYMEAGYRETRHALGAA
jgi:NTE family protein